MQLNIEFHEAKNGDRTLKINDYYIHSKYNPSEEALQIATKKYVPHKGQVIFGYGIGHLVKSLEEIRQFNEPILVFDPLFDRYIQKPKNKNNIYYLDMDFFSDFELNILNLDISNDITYNIVSLSGYEQIFMEGYKTLLLNFKNLQNKNFINDYTILRYSYSWYRNFWTNLLYLEDDCSANILGNRYTAPAVVVSGGPSLTKQIPLLKQYRNQLIVICAGSTINSLLAEGIEPDYVVTVDGGEPNYKHFKNIKLKQSKIVYVLQNHHLVRASFEKPGYIIDSSGFPIISKYIKETLKLDLPVMLGAASVANTAFSFANYITSGPIALIGQDLAYTDNLTHAKSNKNSREIDEAFIKRKNAFKVDGYYSDKVWTDPILDGMRLEFEKIVKINSSTNEIFNCTEGGTGIKYFTQIPFEQFCSQFASSQVEILSNGGGLNQIEFEIVIQNEIKAYKDLKDLLKQSIKLIEHNSGTIQFDPSTLNKLEKNDKKINKLVFNLTIETVISPTITRINKSYLPSVGESKEESFKRTCLQMNDLFITLEKQITECQNILLDLIGKRNEVEGSN